MKKIKKFVFVFAAAFVSLGITGCEEIDGSYSDQSNTASIGNKLSKNQPTPTDIDYSLERYNLIKRAYWVNGMRDKANSLASPIADMPLGYVVLFTESGDVVGQFTIDGKVTSLNSFLTPDSERYSSQYGIDWLPDVDGSYGENDNGIFFFTTDGKYVEWTGTYIYSDIPFDVDTTVLKGE
jgi:hypothetical protein|nr:MAG TPA: hypothetical protein [Caudoviricetes sp.]